jgi:hypothetical protein
MHTCKCCLPYASKDTLLFVSKLLSDPGLMLSVCVSFTACVEETRVKIHNVRKAWIADSLGGTGSSDCT